MEKLKNNLVTIAVIFFVIAILMPIFTLVLYVVPYPDSINGIMRVDNIGSTADFLAGTMTPFLTIAAFFLLLKGYFMQKEELAQTREEMKKSAEALEQQRQIMEDEKRLSESQKEFETFMILLNRWENITKDTNFYIPKLKINTSNNSIEVKHGEEEYINLKNYYKMISNIIANHYSLSFVWESLKYIKLNKFYNGNLLDFTIHIIKGEAFNYNANFYLALKFIDSMKYSDMKSLALDNLKMALIPAERYIFSIIIELNIEVLDTDDKDFKKLIKKYSDTLLL